MAEIETALANHEFEYLFVECLGWDRAHGSVSFEHRNFTYALSTVAQKSGFMVFLCPAHRTVLFDQQRLRNVQQQLCKTHQEYILIHYCDVPHKQVWQWVTSSENGRTVLHRENLFFSNKPPRILLERIRRLSFCIQEQEHLSLQDAHERVQTALTLDSDLILFGKESSIAAKSNRLAMAMKRGEPGAFAAFVEFHMPLTRYSWKMLVHRFGMESADAEQTAMVGLIIAAQHFDPERGYQFSTCVRNWVRQIYGRYGLRLSLPIRIPPRVFWPCYRALFTQAKLIATHGEHDAAPLFDQELARAGISSETWATFCAVRQMDFFSDPRTPDPGTPDSACRKHIDESDVVKQACSHELHEGIQRCLAMLSTREAQVLRMRYGIDEREHTLQEVGRSFGITRESVRQIQIQAEKKCDGEWRDSTSSATPGLPS